MAYYESVFIARQDISAPQVESLADGFASVIEENGGKVTKRESWGLRGLAYKIKKNRKGHYVLFNLDAPAPAVHEMERQMRLNEDILRHMTLRVDELEEGPSVQMQGRANQEERARRSGGDRFGGPAAKDQKPGDEDGKADAKPTEEAPSAPAEEVASEPAEEVASEPAEEVASEPAEEAPSEPAKVAPSEPAEEAPSEPDGETEKSDKAEGEDK